MKKRISYLVAALCCLIQVHAANSVSVADVVIPKGGNATIHVALDNDKAYTAFSMKLTLPEGISYVSVTKGARMDETHGLSGNGSTGMITCLSTSNELFSGTSGELFTISISADDALTVGAKIQATLTEVNFATTAAEETLEDVTINITIDEPDDGYIKFNETATSLPSFTAGEKGNVRITREIKADLWNTIVLPFTLTEAKVEAAFGADVRLAEFSGFEVDYGDDDENVVPLGITVNFSEYALGAKKPMTGGKPFLIKTTSDITSFEAEDVTLFDEVTNVVKTDEYDTSGKFTGTLVKTTVPADGLFISANKFYYSTGATNIKAFRGWFELDAVLNRETDFGVKMFVYIDGEESEIADIQATKTDKQMYDLSGRRIVRPQQRGLYILDGKKVVLK